MKEIISPIVRLVLDLSVIGLIFFVPRGAITGVLALAIIAGYLAWYFLLSPSWRASD